MLHSKETDSLLRRSLRGGSGVRSTSLHKLLLSVAFIAVMVLCGLQPAAADDRSPEEQTLLIKKLKQKLKSPQPLKTASPLVMESPVPGVVILYFQLYDGRTWCMHHIREDHLLQALDANQLPHGADVGQVQCFRRDPRL